MPGATNTPLVVRDCNKHMGDVDKLNQHLSFYFLGHSNYKGWRYLFHFVVNLCVLQFFVTWEQSALEAALPKEHDHLRFRLDVAEQLGVGFRECSFVCRLFPGDKGLQNTQVHDEMEEIPPPFVAGVAQEIVGQALVQFVHVTHVLVAVTHSEWSVLSTCHT